MKIDVHIYFMPDPQVQARLDSIDQKLDLMEKNIMSTLDELKAKADATLTQVTSDTAIDTAVAKVVNDQRQTIIDLKAQLAAAGNDPAKLQALSDTLDNILSLDTSNAKVVSDAVVAGTDPVPQPKPDA